MEFNTMELLKSITLEDVKGYIVGVIGVLSLLVEFNKKIPFSPWSLLINWVGKALTKDLELRLDSIDKQQKANNDAINELDKKVERKFQEKQKDDDEKEAKRLRANIISFSDSCRVGNHHTQNHFENIMRDYGDYISYCNQHNIPNHFIEAEYKYIKEVYSECLKENKFL